MHGKLYTSTVIFIFIRLVTGQTFIIVVVIICPIAIA